MKRFSKHHVGVSKATYNAVFTRDNGRCVICGDDRNEYLHLHHIKTRINKSLIDDPNNCVLLCWKHHQEVHKNMKYYSVILEGIVKGKNL